MTQATVAADLHKALDVLRHLAVQVALHLDVVLDVVAQLGEILFGEVVRTRVSGLTPVSAKIFLDVVRPMP